VIGTRRRSKSSSNSGATADPEPVPIREIIGTASPAISASGVDEMSDPRLLKRVSSRIGSLIAVGVFAAIWNGGLWFVFVNGIGFFRHRAMGLFDWIELIFLLPFLAVGLVLIGVAIYQWMSLYNPKAEITITPGTPKLGGKLDLRWRLTGRIHALRNLKIVLEGREEATYRRGTSTCTDTKSFFILEAASVSHATLMAEGSANVTLPANTMPTFKSPNNRIIWSLRVRGEIPRWPDLNEEFVIDIAPAAINAP